MKIQSWPTACRSALALAALLFASPLAAQTASTEVLNENVLQILGIEKNHFDGNAAEPATAENLKQARQLLAEGVSAMQRGDAQAALAKFKDAKAKDPALSQPNLYLARLCFATNDQNVVNAGRGFLEQAAAEKDAKSPEPHLLLAKLALNENRLSDAELQFERALEIITANPDSTWTPKRTKDFQKEIHAGKASAHERMRNWIDAEAELKSWAALLDKDEKDAVLHLRQGQLFFMMGVQGDKKPGERINAAAVDQAAAELELAYESAEKTGEKGKEVKSVLRPELLLLDMLTSIEETKLAEEQIKKLEAAKTDLDAEKLEGARTWQAVANWYLRQGNFEKAREYAERAKTLDPDSSAIEQLKAMTAYFSNDMKTARDSWEAMYQKNPADFLASNNLALILCESDVQADKDRAVAIAEVNARANQQSQFTAEALSTLGWVYYNVERYAEAAQIFAKFEQTQGLQISADTAYYMARTFLALDDKVLPNQQARDQAQARARQLIEQALATKGAFRYRSEAQEWLDFVKGGGRKPSTAPKVTPASTTPKEPVPPATVTPPADGSGT